MKIMFLVSSLYGGGAERVVTRLASALCEDNEVHIVVTQSLSQKDGIYPLDGRVIVHEAPIIKTTSSKSANPMRHIVSRGVNKIRRHLRSSKAPFGKTLAKTADNAAKPLREARWKNTRKLKQDLGIDVAISFLTGSNMENVMSHGTETTIVSVRNILNTPYAFDKNRFSPEQRDMIRYAGAHADHIVSVSRNVGIEQVEVYGVDPSRVTTIYNPIDAASVLEKARKPIDDAAFNEFRERHGLLALSMGRFVPQKGFWHLLRAFKNAHEQLPQAGLAILGTGEQEPLLRNLIDALGLSEHVLLDGFRDEPSPYMAASDVFCMASLFEGFSNAMLEAMACNTPLVVPDCNSGPRELMAPNTDSTYQTTELELTPYGYLTPRLSGNMQLTTEPLEPAEKALADALTSLLDNNALRERCRKNCAERVLDFSNERIIGQWMALIEQLANNKNQGR